MATDNFKALWQKQAAPAMPDAKDLIEKAIAFKKENLRRLLLLNVTLIVTAIFVCFIWYYYQPQLLTTKIGIVLTIIAIVAYLFASNKLIPLIKNANVAASNDEYLQQLIVIRNRQFFLQKTMLNLYFLFFTTGLCLYMIEYTMRMKTVYAIFAYAVMFAWIGFNWFYTRPRSTRKQQQKINALIEKLQSVQQQLSE